MISVRSYLAAGSAAVLGASAIALTPVLPGRPLSLATVPAPAVAEIALTGISLSLGDIIGVVQTLGSLGGSLTGILDGLLPQEFVSDVISEILDQAGPLISAAADEVFGYFGTTLAGLPGEILTRVVQAAGNIPTVLTGAFQALSTGDIVTAVQTVTTGLVAPFAAIGQTIADAVDAFQGLLAGELTYIVGALPGILFTSIQTVVGDSVQASLDAITDALSDLFGGLFPAAAAPAAAGLAVGGSVAPRPAASAPPEASAPVADIAAIAEVAAPEVESQSAPKGERAPRTTRGVRPRPAAALPADPAESVANGPAVTSRPAPAPRAARQDAQRPAADAPTRAARSAR